LEPIIRIKPHLMKKIGRMLAPGEALLAAIPHGEMKMDGGGEAAAAIRNCLVLTDKRVIDVSAKFFVDGTGFRAFPRKLCAGARMRPFQVRCSLRVILNDPRAPGGSVELEFNNCKKPDAEAVMKELTAGAGDGKIYKCPACSRILDRDHTFCPGCGAAIKYLCPRCGKPVPRGEEPCPWCER